MNLLVVLVERDARTLNVFVSTPVVAIGQTFHRTSGYSCKTKLIGIFFYVSSTFCYRLFLLVLEGQSWQEYLTDVGTPLRKAPFMILLFSCPKSLVSLMMLYAMLLSYQYQGC